MPKEQGRTPRIVEAILIENGEEKKYSIEEALEKKGLGYRLPYLCPECHKNVIPFRGPFAPHFEHKKKNPYCPRYTRSNAKKCPEVNRISGNSYNVLSNNIVSTMEHIVCLIKGIPYPAKKKKGDIKASERWTNAIISQTEHLKKIKDACILRITFLLPPDKYPKDLPYGTDLDNLIKNLWDALNKTIFKEAEGKDSCVIELSAIKTRVEAEDEAGAFIEILPIRIKSSGK